jgi:hypothetical protein
MLARNSDLDSAVYTVRALEDRFNRKYGYPWVFLNEEPFSDDFKRSAPFLFFVSVYPDLVPTHHQACVKSHLGIYTFCPDPRGALVSTFVDR